MGPRASLNLQALPATTVVFGDETSFGLVTALAHHSNTQVHCIFEVNAPNESRIALDAIKAPPAALVARLPRDGHLPDLVEAAIQFDKGAAFVLSGKAGSIQFLNRALKLHGRSRAGTKVYWSPGKPGLD
jgi:NADPH-dependent ferric siderophore reductase